VVDEKGGASQQKTAGREGRKALRKKNEDMKKIFLYTLACSRMEGSKRREKPESEGIENCSASWRNFGHALQTST